METSIIILFYILLTLVPIHVATFLAIRTQNKKRRHLLMALWKMAPKARFRR